MKNVSVIVPVYNSGEYLSRCLESIVNQTERNFEIICINDGSSDNSLAILNSFAQKDDRIIIHTTANRGVGPARNRGIELSSGKYIFFVDADDYLDNSVLEKVYQQISHNDADICIFDAQFSSGMTACFCLKNDIFEKIQERGKSFSWCDFPEDIFQLTLNACWGKMFRRDFIVNNKIAFPHLAVGQDIFFTFLAIIEAKKITFTDYVGYYYNEENVTSITHVKAKISIEPLESFRLLNKRIQDKRCFAFIKKSFANKVLRDSLYILGKVNSYSLFVDAYDRVQELWCVDLQGKDFLKKDFYEQSHSDFSHFLSKKMGREELLFSYYIQQKNQRHYLAREILTYHELITELGSATHSQRLRAELAERKCINIQNQYEERIKIFINSRSWRIMSSFRKIGRFLRKTTVFLLDYLISSRIVVKITTLVSPLEKIRKKYQVKINNFKNSRFV